MKFNPNFSLRDVCGEKLLIATGIESIDFSSLIDLNPTALDIYNHFVDKEFSLDDIVQFLTSEYDVTPEVALQDTETLLESLSEHHIVIK